MQALGRCLLTSSGPKITVCLRLSHFPGIKVEASIYSTATTAFTAWYVVHSVFHEHQEDGTLIRSCAEKNPPLGHNRISQRHPARWVSAPRPLHGSPPTEHPLRCRRHAYVYHTDQEQGRWPPSDPHVSKLGCVEQMGRNTDELLRFHQ